MGLFESCIVNLEICDFLCLHFENRIRSLRLNILRKSMISSNISFGTTKMIDFCSYFFQSPYNPNKTKAKNIIIVFNIGMNVTTKTCYKQIMMKSISSNPQGQLPCYHQDDLLNIIISVKIDLCSISSTL